MAKLTEPIKRFIVGRLACYYTPTEVTEQVQDEFGLKLTRSQVGFYDATTKQGARELSPELRDLFAEAREEFNSDLKRIPAASKAYRLRKIQDLIDRNPRNPRLVAQLLEQAAKETGGLFQSTRRTELTGRDGTPLISVDEALKVVFAGCPMLSWTTH